MDLKGIDQQKMGGSSCNDGTLNLPWNLEFTMGTHGPNL
jgi:hypothetical protein